MCLHVCLSVTHVHTHFSFLFLTMKEKGIFVLHIPDSQILPPQWIDCGKVKRETSKEKGKTGGGISQLNISGTFPSLSPLECLYQTRLSLKVCRKPQKTRNHTVTLTGMP